MPDFSISKPESTLSILHVSRGRMMKYHLSPGKKETRRQGENREMGRRGREGGGKRGKSDGVVGIVVPFFSSLIPSPPASVPPSQCDFLPPHSSSFPSPFICLSRRRRPLLFSFFDIYISLPRPLSFSPPSNPGGGKRRRRAAAPHVCVWCNMALRPEGVGAGKGGGGASFPPSLPLTQQAATYGKGGA